MLFNQRKVIQKRYKKDGFAGKHFRTQSPLCSGCPIVYPAGLLDSVIVLLVKKHARFFAREHGLAEYLLHKLLQCSSDNSE